MCRPYGKSEKKTVDRINIMDILRDRRKRAIVRPSYRNRQMGDRIWFIRDKEGPIKAFPSKRGAFYEREALEREEEDETMSYRVYAREVDDLEDYPDELELAEEEGLL
jgi:hypothetical protein